MRIKTEFSFEAEAEIIGLSTGEYYFLYPNGVIELPVGEIVDIPSDGIELHEILKEYQFYHIGSSDLRVNITSEFYEPIKSEQKVHDALKTFKGFVVEEDIKDIVKLLRGLYIPQNLWTTKVIIKAFEAIMALQEYPDVPDEEALMEEESLFQEQNREYLYNIGRKSPY